MIKMRNILINMKHYKLMKELYTGRIDCMSGFKAMTYSQVHKTLCELEKRGIVKKTIYGRRNQYDLTKKGKEIYESLKKINDLQEQK